MTLSWVTRWCQAKVRGMLTRGAPLWSRASKERKTTSWQLRGAPGGVEAVMGAAESIDNGTTAERPAGGDGE